MCMHVSEPSFSPFSFAPTNPQMYVYVNAQFIPPTHLPLAFSHNFFWVKGAKRVSEKSAPVMSPTLSNVSVQ